MSVCQMGGGSPLEGGQALGLSASLWGEQVISYVGSGDRANPDGRPGVSRWAIAGGTAGSGGFPLPSPTGRHRLSIIATAAERLGAHRRSSDERVESGRAVGLRTHAQDRRRVHRHERLPAPALLQLPRSPPTATVRSSTARAAVAPRHTISVGIHGIAARRRAMGRTRRCGRRRACCGSGASLGPRTGSA